MDPRLNPIASASPPLQDIKPTPNITAPIAQAPTSPPATPLTTQTAAPAPLVPPQPAPILAAVPSNSPMKAEIVGSFPVSIRGAGNPVTNASAMAPGPTAHTQMPGYGQQPAPAEQDDLDRILQAVNNRVKTPMATDKPKKQLIKKIGKNSPKTPKDKTVAGPHKPYGVMAAVAAVALLLSASAVYAYRQSATQAVANQPGKVGTSYAAGAAIQAAGGTLIRAADLDDFSGTATSKLNSLNDSQDFAADPLTDKTLGL